MSTRTQLTLNSHIRILGEDATASKTLLRAAKQENPPFQLVGNPPNPALPDFCLIDTVLQVDYAKPAPEFPQAGLGYAGFTPSQRAAYLAWLDDPARPAAMAFQQLYIATLEVALFEGKKEAAGAQRELLRLDIAPAWHNHELLDRALLLSFWLQQDGSSLLRWLTNIDVGATVVPLAIGQLALLQQPATLSLLLALMKAWKLLETNLPLAVLEMRLNSLNEMLGKELLAHALEKLGETVGSPQGWRCAHRDLRIALPQPNLRPLLEPLLRDTTTLVDAHIAPVAIPTEATPVSIDQSKWNLVLEFEHSRSSYFPFALEVAQRQEGYTLLMDENRHMVYRVIFRKNNLRPFWRMWDWVQPWGGTRVYVNGKALEKWQVWPYSQYIQ